MKSEFTPVGSAEHPCFPKSFWSLQSQADSSELQSDLGRPVPCEQGAADTYGLPPLPPTSDFVFMCYCICVLGVIRLWDCGVVSLWVCGCVLVWVSDLCVCVCVCVFTCLSLFACSVRLSDHV